MRWASAIMLLLLVPATGAACSFTYFVYPWSPRVGYPDELRLGGPLPRLLVTSSLTRRPPVPPPPDEIEVAGCDTTADFEVNVKLANLEPARLARFGYLFSVKSADGRHLFWVDSSPVAVHRIEGDSAVFEIHVGDFWRDELHRPIDVELEVVAVDADMRRGRPTTFRLQADARAPRPGKPKRTPRVDVGEPHYLNP